MIIWHNMYLTSTNFGKLLKFPEICTPSNSEVTTLFHVLCTYTTRYWVLGSSSTPMYSPCCHLSL